MKRDALVAFGFLVRVYMQALSSLLLAILKSNEMHGFHSQTRIGPHTRLQCPSVNAAFEVSPSGHPVVHES